MYLTLYGHIKPTEQQTVIQQYGDWHTGTQRSITYQQSRYGCYIWYSKEGTGRAVASPSPLLAVRNVTAHASTASLLTP